MLTRTTSSPPIFDQQEGAMRINSDTHQASNPPAAVASPLSIIGSIVCVDRGGFGWPGVAGLNYAFMADR